jgi:hypothetical protein
MVLRFTSVARNQARSLNIVGTLATHHESQSHFPLHAESCKDSGESRLLPLRHGPTKVRGEMSIPCTTAFFAQVRSTTTGSRPLVPSPLAFTRACVCSDVVDQRNCRELGQTRAVGQHRRLFCCHGQQTCLSFLTVLHAPRPFNRGTHVGCCSCLHVRRLGVTRSRAGL